MKGSSEQAQKQTLFPNRRAQTQGVNRTQRLLPRPKRRCPLGLPAKSIAVFHFRKTQASSGGLRIRLSTAYHGARLEEPEPPYPCAPGQVEPALFLPLRLGRIFLRNSYRSRGQRFRRQLWNAQSTLQSEPPDQEDREAECSKVVFKRCSCKPN